MRLYGREAETGRIDSLLDAARAGRSAVLVVRGEPGIGKTALLRYAARRAQETTVLSARGLEIDQRLAFSGLADLFLPVLGRLEAIPRPQSAALAGALGLGAPVAGDGFLVRVATLSLLSAAAEERPVLALLDDSQWLDEASREAILFVARHLEAERVALILTTLLSESTVDSFGLDEVTLVGLVPPAAGELLEEQLGYPVAPQVLDQLAKFSGGNPLALCELARDLSEAQLRGTEVIGEGRLPPKMIVERAFLRRIERLSPQTREALVVVAADSGVTSTIGAACELLGLPPACLQQAEEAGVIRADGSRTSFTHPLLRAAVYHAAPRQSRDRAHRALAEVLRAGDKLGGNGGRLGPSHVERRAWQLAAATPEPDEAVASTLVAAATEARSRAGYAAAAAGLERAARLTPSPEQRAARLVDGARDWHLAGRSDAALGLLDEAVPLAGDSTTRVAAQHLRGRIMMLQGRLADASELLAAEAAGVAEQDPETAVSMLLDAAVAASSSGAVGRAVELAREAWRLAEPLGGQVADAARVLIGGELEAHGEPLNDEERGLVVDAMSSLARLTPPPPIVTMFPIVLANLEEYDQARMLLDRFHDEARALGAATILVPVLCLRSDVEFRTGDWVHAYADAAESVRLARETRQLAFHSLAFLARVEAARGLETHCRAHAAEALEQAERDGIGAAMTYSRWALGLLELGLGRMSETIEQLEQVAELVEEHEMGQPVEVPWAQDLIEAYTRSGRSAEATAVLRRLETLAENARLSSALAAASRCRGLLADENVFAGEFEQALMWHKRTPTPFERARTELCYGERLRRARSRSDARTHLRAALQTFDRLNAAPWAARARTELAATGEVVRPRSEEGLASLTPQELQLALIVGRGATNKEASAALFVSPKTVEAHLHRTYVKLGIRSRTELARLLAREQILD